MNRTLGNALCSRDNALNFIRLLLAMAVIFWHTYPTSGAIPSWPAAELGAWAVNAFFALSGFLIAGSRLHLKFWPYLGRRAARVFPAFWTVLVVTGFVFAPISTIFTGRAYRLDDGLNYVAQNSLLWLGELGVGETLRGIPHPDSWNGSLWTLFFEFGAYLAAGTLLSIRLVRRKLVWVSLAILAILSVAVASGIGEGFPRLLDQIVPGRPPLVLLRGWNAGVRASRSNSHHRLGRTRLRNSPCPDVQSGGCGLAGTDSPGGPPSLARRENSGESRILE